MPAGRPRKYSDEDLEQIGEDLIKWCAVPDKNWHICGFEADNNLPVDFCKNMVKSRPEQFSPTYKRAKEILGVKLLEHSMHKDKKANPWVLATLLPHYISDVDDAIDNRKQKDLEMAEKAKKLAEMGTEDRTEKLLGKMDEYIGKVDERAIQPEAD